MALNSKNQRQFQRFHTDLACRFRDEGTFPWADGELMNLSKGGVCLKAKVPPQKDATVELEVDLFTDEGVWKSRKMRARVMWRKGKRAGLSFTS